MVAAGVLVDAEEGREPYDRFRGRVIIPIANERGEFVALAGRGLHGEEPKYLNSPQTEIFDKGRTLFGLHAAADAIRLQGEVVVVEGYMDVLGPWQAGYRNVVATMGTSLTRHHAALLRRFAPRIVLALDPDAAGMNAAERAGSLLFGFSGEEHAADAARAADALAVDTDIDLRVAPLPAGRDPDELVRDDRPAWERAIAGAQPFVEFLLFRMLGERRPVSPLEVRHLVDRLSPVLLAVSDPVERGLYIQRVPGTSGSPRRPWPTACVADARRAPGQPRSRQRAALLGPRKSCSPSSFGIPGSGSPIAITRSRSSPALSSGRFSAAGSATLSLRWPRRTKSGSAPANWPRIGSRRSPKRRRGAPLTGNRRPAQGAHPSPPGRACGAAFRG
jgi:DNA primase